MRQLSTGHKEDACRGARALAAIVNSDDDALSAGGWIAM